MEYSGESLDRIKADLFFNEEAGTDVMLPLGILDALSGEVPEERIHLNTIVTGIEWTSRGADVICQNGHKFAAEYVICTLPVSFTLQAFFSSTPL